MVPLANEIITYQKHVALVWPGTFNLKDKPISNISDLSNTSSNSCSNKNIIKPLTRIVNNSHVYLRHR